MKQPGVNPITVRGVRSLTDKTERCLAVGRLWITRTDVSDGQSRFDPLNRTQRQMDRTMQFVLFEGESNILAFMLGDEIDFIPSMKAMMAGKVKRFSIMGTAARRSSDRRMTVYEKVGDSMLMVSMYEGMTTEGEPISSVLMDYDHYCNGLQFLFNNGELV